MTIFLIFGPVRQAQLRPLSSDRRARTTLLPYALQLAAFLAVFISAAPTAAQPSSPSPQQSPPAPSAAQQVWAGCSELIPKNATRPKMQVMVPEDGIAGYALEVTIIVEHGAGETVMPGGFHLDRGSDAMRALEEREWILPAADGGAGPFIDRAPASADRGTAVTTLKVPFVPLPKEPGRRTLTLPPLPISVARASGEMMTLCTPAREVIVEDPVANEVDPKVRHNPPARPQRERWEAARTAAMIAAAVLLLGALLGWVFSRLNQRFKPAPVKAKMLPWISAVKELNALRDSELIKEERYDEFIDTVNDITRRYLGERYGFDGIESTSSEVRELLQRVYPPIKSYDEISDFLADTDLIKFAKVTPDAEQCEDALGRAFEIVRATTPPGVVRIDVDGPPTERFAA